MFDKTDIFLQLTKTFGAHTVQIHLGTVFGNPEDIKITGKISHIYALELEHGYLLDILSINWNSYVLTLRGMPLVLPLSKTLTGFNRILIRQIFKSPHGMYKVIACNKFLCHLTILQPYTKILEQPTKRRPTKPTRLNLKEPMYMEMANSLANQSILFTNAIIEGSRCNPNKSCVPSRENGTMLDRSHTSLPIATMGDYRRSSEMDQDQQPAEVRTRPAVPEDPDTDIEAEKLIINESGGRAHPDGDEVTSHPV